MEKDPQIIKVDIPMSEDDCYQIIQGESFDWTFTTKDGKFEIKTHIRLETDEDIEGIE